MVERGRKWWWKGVCIFGVALAITLLLVTPTLAWWNADWKCRRAITIQSDNALTDYQILVQLNDTNFNFFKAKSDGSDIRFVDEDDATKLSYWIERWDSVNESAKIWVNISLIPVGEKTIYLYYNNSDAVSESDSEATFLLFDDFDDGILASGWEEVWDQNNACVWSEENGILRGDASGATAVAFCKGGNLTDVEIFVKVRMNNAENRVGVVARASEGGNHYVVRLNPQDDTFYLAKWKDTSFSSGASTPFTSDLNTWYEVYLRVWSDNIEAGVRNVGNTSWITVSDTFTDFSSGKVGVGGWFSDINSYDEFRVRKYIFPEPSISLGAEEEYHPPIEVICNSPSAIQVNLYFTEKNGYILIGTSADKSTYAYEFHGSGTYTLTTSFLLPNKTYYIKACDIDGNCTNVTEFTCNEETKLEKKNFTAPFNNLMQSGNLLNISKLGETIPSVYTSLLTDMFWAMFFGGIFLAYWIRQEDVMLPSIMGMISGVAMIGLLPPSAQHIAYILLVISIAGTLYTIIKARR